MLACLQLVSTSRPSQPFHHPSTSSLAATHNLSLPTCHGVCSIFSCEALPASRSFLRRHEVTRTDAIGPSLRALPPQLEFRVFMSLMTQDTLHNLAGQTVFHARSRALQIQISKLISRAESLSPKSDGVAFQKGEEACPSTWEKGNRPLPPQVYRVLT